MALPYNMTPAPRRIVDSPVVDLGPYSDGEYAGWKVVFRAETPLWVNEVLTSLQDEGASVSDKVRAIYEVIGVILVAWNFTRTVLDSNGEEVTENLAQPGKGGEREMDVALLEPIMKAYAARNAPAKNS